MDQWSVIKVNVTWLGLFLKCLNILITLGHLYLVYGIIERSNVCLLGIIWPWSHIHASMLSVFVLVCFSTVKRNKSTTGLLICKVNMFVRHNLSDLGLIVINLCNSFCNTFIFNTLNIKSMNSRRHISAWSLLFDNFKSSGTNNGEWNFKYTLCR